MAELCANSDSTSQGASIPAMGAHEKSGQAWTMCMGTGKEDMMESPLFREYLARGLGPHCYTISTNGGTCSGK